MLSGLLAIFQKISMDCSDHVKHRCTLTAAFIAKRTYYYRGISKLSSSMRKAPAKAVVPSAQTAAKVQCLLTGMMGRHL